MEPKIPNIQASTESAQQTFRNYQYAKEHLKGEPTERFRQFKNLAENGHARSMCEIGRAYYVGIGTEANPAEAEMWFRRAADLGDLWGYFYLGWSYHRQKRYEEARQVFTIAAAAEFSPALYYLGKIYLLGLGVEKDLPKAKNYLARAMNAGSLFAKARLRKILMKESSLKAKLWGAFIFSAAFLELFKVLIMKGFASVRLVQ